MEAVETNHAPKVGDVVCRYVGDIELKRLRVTKVISAEEFDFFAVEILSEKKRAQGTEPRIFPVRLRPQRRVSGVELLRHLDQWCFAPQE